MTTWRAMSLGWLLAAVVACAGSDAPKYPDWPTLPAVPDKKPEKKTEPVVVGSLTAGKLYVVQHNGEPVQLLASPEGIVAVSELASGTVINGVFADGKGERETRTYSGKQVWLVERVAQGNVELLKVPKGPIERRLLTDDQFPIPPPKPVDPKPVEPDVKPIEKSPWDNAPGLRVLIVYPKRGNLTADQQTIIIGKRVRDYVDAKCVKENGEPAYWFLKTDEDVSGLGAGWQKAYALAANRTWVVVGNGARWEQGPLPANPDKMLELLKKYGDTFGGP